MPSIDFLFEHSEPFIEVLGDKGYDRFCSAFFESTKPDGGEFFIDDLTYEEVGRIVIETLFDKFISFEEKGIRESSPAISKMMLWAFVDMEKKGGAPEKLKNWVYSCLDKISKGEDPVKVFKLKRSTRGKRSSFDPLDLKVACKFKLLRQDGLSFEEAQFACHEEFGINERTIARIVKRTTLPENASAKLIETYSRVDTSSFFKPILAKTR